MSGQGTASARRRIAGLRGAAPVPGSVRAIVAGLAFAALLAAPAAAAAKTFCVGMGGAGATASLAGQAATASRPDPTMTA